MTQNSTIQRPKIALFEPDIPQNTGAIIRTCACLGAKLEIIEPCGFLLNDRRLQRVVMDYMDEK
jgi:tRNA (cytidine/uridine-2'-O-)-methyltransferase